MTESTHRFENRRPAAISCEGEPAPERGTPDILEAAVRPGDRPKGDRNVLPTEGGGSFGDVVVGEVERWAAVECGG